MKKTLQRRIKNEQKKSTVVSDLGFSTVAWYRQVGVSAATELQYVYLTPSENGNQTGVVIALDGEKVTEASLG